MVRKLEAERAAFNNLKRKRDSEYEDDEEEEKKPHVKKPLNAFMLFMKEQRQKVVNECTLKESAAINQILGRKWHSLSKEEQQKYYDEARKAREKHLEMYPELGFGRKKLFCPKKIFEYQKFWGTKKLFFQTLPMVGPRQLRQEKTPQERKTPPPKRPKPKQKMPGHLRPRGPAALVPALPPQKEMYQVHWLG